MGFSSGSDVFNPVANLVIQKVENGVLAETVAQEILISLISGLQSVDWDVEDECLEEFFEYTYIVSAFEAQGITLDDDEDEDEDDEDDWDDEDNEDEDEDEDEEVQ